MEYKIAICDDEQAERQYLFSLVKKWALREKHTVEVSVFENAEAFLFRYAEEKDYDILLLDIEMGDLNGVGLAKKSVPIMVRYRFSSLRHILILLQKDMKCLRSII